MSFLLEGTTLSPGRLFVSDLQTRVPSLCKRLICFTVLGALSKALATIATQPLIVAKVGLQSRPPPGREGKPFKTFGEVMRYIIQNEGALSLFKGIGPQITKGLLVQGLLMMTKERYVPSLSDECILECELMP
jgi:hypothetical protein